VDHRDKPGDDDFSGSVLSLISIGVMAGRGDEALLRADVPAMTSGK